MRVAVVGASGFLGSAIVSRLVTMGVDVAAVTAPRLSGIITADPARLAVLESLDAVAADLASRLLGAAIVINAAGCPDATSCDTAMLLAANAYVPLAVHRAAVMCGAERVIHISSSVVQGDVPTLDESTDYRSLSPYAESKIQGERLLLGLPDDEIELVVYRPPSVHGPNRRITRRLTKLARSPLSSVAGSGLAPTPQALLASVVDAVAFMAQFEGSPPRVVAHPWEGLTTGSLLRVLGGREPLHLPAPAARAAVSSMKSVESLGPNLVAMRRRVELLWFGQGVGPSWLTSAGWSIPTTWIDWERLAAEVQSLP